MQEVGRTRLFILAAGDEQQVLLRGDLDLVTAETGDRDGDAIPILGQTLEVEGRIILGRGTACVGFEKVEQPVEADGRTAIRGQVESHLQNLQKKRVDVCGMSSSLRHPGAARSGTARNLFGSR